MQSIRLTISLLASLFLFSTAASAAPPHAAGKTHKNHKPPVHVQAYKPRPAPRQPAVQKHQRRKNWHPAYQPPPPQRHQPPSHHQLRRNIYRHSHHLQRGPALPQHIKPIVGRPLPHGWHHRLPPHQARYLPYYPGYEWHSTGRDLILVAVGSGIIYSILDNVLN